MPSVDLTEKSLAVARPHSSSHRWWVLAVLGLAQLMVVLDASVVNIALPSAQHALGFSDAGRQWVITAYSLSFGGLLLLGGRMSDLLGRKRVFLAGVVGFALASAVGGASTGFAMLVAARAAQGAFGALLAPAALSLLTTTFSEPSERGKAFGIYGAIAGAGGAIGLLLGGALTEYLDWRWCLYVNVGFAVLAGFGAVTFLRDQERAVGARLDIPGTLLAVGGLVALVYGFSEAATHSWSSPLTVGLLAGSVVLLAGFVIGERRVAHPLLPLRIVRDRQRGGANLSILFVGIGMFGVFLFLTYYLQQTLGYSPIRTGLAFLPMVGSLMITGTIGGTVFLPRFGPRWLVAGGMLVAGAGLVLMSRFGVQSSYTADVLPALIVTGLGIGAVFGATMNIATHGADPADAGVASALPNVALQVGGALGPALLNTIFANSVTAFLATADRRPTPALLVSASVHGDAKAFTVAYVILFVSAVVSAIVLTSGVPEGSMAALPQ